MDGRVFASGLRVYFTKDRRPSLNCSCSGRLIGCFSRRMRLLSCCHSRKSLFGGFPSAHSYRVTPYSQTSTYIRLAFHSSLCTTFKTDDNEDLPHQNIPGYPTRVLEA